MHINSETILQKGFRLPSCSASAGLLADSIDENQKKTTFAGERGDADVQVAFLLCNCRALGGSESIDENPKKTMFAYNFLNVLRTEPGQNIATVLEPRCKTHLPTSPFNPQFNVEYVLGCAVGQTTFTPEFDVSCWGLSGQH